MALPTGLGRSLKATSADGASRLHPPRVRWFWLTRVVPPQDRGERRFESHPMRASPIGPLSFSIALALAKTVTLILSRTSSTCLVGRDKVALSREKVARHLARRLKKRTQLGTTLKLGFLCHSECSGNGHAVREGRRKKSTWECLKLCDTSSRKTRSRHPETS